MPLCAGPHLFFFLIDKSSSSGMARKKTANTTSALEMESSVPPIVEINYVDPLFTVAAHPIKPIIMAGLGTGHLYCHSYNAESLEETVQNEREKAELKEKNSTKVSISSIKKKWWISMDSLDLGSTGDFSTNWKTKRHKGSCRSVIFDILENSTGDFIYSVGTDHIIKRASTETGKVTAKTSVSNHYDGKDAITNMCLSSTHPFLLTGTENGHILVFDSHELSSKKLKFKLPNIHEDSINKILPMPAISAYHYLTLGSTTLAHIDIRKGVITQSDDQADELLSMCYATDSINANKNDTVLVSHGEGIVTLWKNSNNGLADQISRVKVNKNASIDAIIPTMNEGVEDLKDSVWCGDSEGILHRVNYKKGRVVETRVHSSVMGKLGGMDEVGGLDIDYDYRLISSGMDGLKIWSGQLEKDQQGVLDDDDLDSSVDDSDDIHSGSDSFFDNTDLEGEEEGEEEEEEEEEDAIIPNKDENDSEEVGFDASEGSEDEESTPSTHSTPQIVRKKRTDIATVVMKPKKRMIDINKITRSEQLSESGQEQQKKKQKKVKTLVPNNGIAKFDGL